MANAFKKLLILSVIVALSMAFMVTASIVPYKQASAFTPCWDDYATPEEEMSGSGTLSSPYIISSAEDLARVSLWVNAGTNTTSYYALRQDINLAGNIFVPIGNETNPFGGNFDGGNHKISGLSINTDGIQDGRYFLGLFGVTNTSSIIKSFGITSGSISFSCSQEVDSVYIGSIAAINSGSIENVFSYATSQVSLVGGYSQEAFVGGISGSNIGTAAIRRAVFGGIITAEHPIDALGGISGNNNSIIEDVFNAGQITSSEVLGITYVGGINGINTGNLKFAINSGAITGIRAGGIAGQRIGNSITYSYYDADLSGITNAVYGAADIDQPTNKVMGLTSAQLHASSINSLNLPQDKWGKYSGSAYDFDGTRYFAPYITAINTISPTHNQAAATLRVYGYDFNKIFDTANPHGSASHPYIISSSRQLAYMAQYVNAGYNYNGKYFKVQGDQDGKLDLTGFSNTIGTRGLSGGDKPFQGSFNGNNVTLSNFILDRSSATSEQLKANIGLFGYIDALGHIFDLRLDSTCSVVGKEYTGSVVGYNSGRVENIETQATVRGNAFVGGLIGYNSPSAVVNDILSAATVLGNVGASNIYGVIGDGSFANSVNVWYAAPSTAACTDTKGRGRALIIDIPNADRTTDPITGDIVFGKIDDYGFHSVAVGKDTNGKISFKGNAVNPWLIEYRYADQKVAYAQPNYEPPRTSTETRTIYARLVRPLKANVLAEDGQKLYFSRTESGGTYTYTTTANFYRGQEVTMYSQAPQGYFLHSNIARMQEAGSSNMWIEDTFNFSYLSGGQNEGVMIKFTMQAQLVDVTPSFTSINAPAVLPKIYDGTSSLFMGGGEPYSVNISGFTIDYSYNVAGGAPKAAGDNYLITINVRSIDGVLRGSQTVAYTITPKQITLSQDMLTRQKEYDGSTQPIAAAVINQAAITDIIAGDAVVITSTAVYSSTDIGWTTANFSFALSGASARNYYTPSDLNNISCEITKRTLIISISSENLIYVYNGSAAEVAYFGYTKAPLSWLPPVADIYMSKDIVGTRVNAVDVGTYDVNVRLRDEPQYYYEGRPITYYYTAVLASRYTFTITPKPVDISYGDYEGLVYNSGVQSIRAFYNDINNIRQEVSSSCLSYTMVAGSGSGDQPNVFKNAGSYIASVTLPTSGNYIATAATSTFAVSLAKANQPPISIAPLTGPFVYGDAPRTLAINGAAADATGSVTFTVLSGRAVIDGQSIEFTAGGDIYIAATKEADSNYHIATTPNYRITVAKAVIKIDLADITKTFGDTLDTLDFIFDGWVSRDQGITQPLDFVPPIVMIVADGTNELVNPHKKYHAGTYTLQIQQTAASSGYTFDYSLLDPMPTYTLQKRAVTLTPDNKSQTYGRADTSGNPQDLPLTYTVYSGDTNLAVSLNNIILSRDAGNNATLGANFYSIFCTNQQAAIDNNPDYDITFTTGEYRIVPKVLFIIATSSSKIFGNADPAPKYTASGLASWDTEAGVISAKNEALPILTREVGENAYYRYSQEYGVYNYSAANIALTSNYTLSFISGTLTIYKAEPLLKQQSTLNVPYGDDLSTIQPSAVFVVSIGGQETTVKGSLVWLDGSSRPVFGGANQFGARFTPSANYSTEKLENNISPIDTTLSVGIYKREAVLLIAKTTFTYTGKQQAFNYTIDNVLEGDIINDSITYSAPMLNADSYTVTISIDNGNYTLITPQGEYTNQRIYNITIQKVNLLIYLQDIELGEGIRPPKDFIYEGFVNGETEDNLTTKPQVDFHTEVGNYDITPYGAESANYNITYQSSKQSVTKTMLKSEVQNFTIAGNFDYLTEMTVTELYKSANRSLFSMFNDKISPIKSINKLGNVQISRLYNIAVTVDGQAIALSGDNRATLEIPTRLRESKRFYIVLIDQDGNMRLAQNVARDGNNLSFDIEDCATVGIVNPPDYTFIILGCVVVLLVIAVFALDIVSERLGIGRHKKSKAGKTKSKN